MELAIIILFKPYFKTTSLAPSVKTPTATLSLKQGYECSPAFQLYSTTCISAPKHSMKKVSYHTNTSNAITRSSTITFRLIANSSGIRTLFSLATVVNPLPVRQIYLHHFLLNDRIISAIVYIFLSTKFTLSDSRILHCFAYFSDFITLRRIYIFFGICDRQTNCVKWYLKKNMTMTNFYPTRYFQTVNFTASTMIEQKSYILL